MEGNGSGDHFNLILGSGQLRELRRAAAALDLSVAQIVRRCVHSQMRLMQMQAAGATVLAITAATTSGTVPVERGF